jgi:TetR/AcrR family transcriptional regulator, regulator of cefoperazone and chloramphenicol sensitivity
VTRPKPGDRETRQRLSTAASRLFADRGFGKIAVREICRAARADVAAVSYHFGDKLGLYRDVMQPAIDAMRSTSEAALAAGEGLPPAGQLRKYIPACLRRPREGRSRRRARRSARNASPPGAARARP